MIRRTLIAIVVGFVLIVGLIIWLRMPDEKPAAGHSAAAADLSTAMPVSQAAAQAEAGGEATAPAGAADMSTASAGPQPAAQVQADAAGNAPETLSLGPRTKSSNCQVKIGHPDAACTPGAILPGVTKEQVCTPGYSSGVRDVSSALKAQVFGEYGVKRHSPGQYEIDHFISLELGGSNDIANLWPELASPRPGFHEKDRVENYLHKKVCDGEMTLEEAQAAIASDWLAVYHQMPRTSTRSQDLFQESLEGAP